MNVRMWIKALRVIPRITKEEWDELDIISRWLISTRAAVIIMTFISAAIAGIWAFRDGQFNFVLWALTAFGLMMAHATNNIVNDITDFKRGVDLDNYFRAQYGPQPLTHELMTLRQSWTYAAVTGFIALAVGAYLVFVRGNLVLALLASGAFFVLFYTYPLKYIGLGELAVLLVWGPLMIGGGYYVVTGHWSWEVVWISLPYALGTTGVLFGKHIDKVDGDRSKNIRTLPVLIGERNARVVMLGMVTLQYVLVVVMVLLRVFTPVMLVVFLAWKMFTATLKVFSQPRPAGPPPDYPAEAWPMWYVSFAFVHNRDFGLWFLLGLIVDAVLRSFHIL
jgi:1,4-dihydroxy-2-naphthoate octaprenyltransferase